MMSNSNVAKFPISLQRERVQSEEKAANIVPVQGLLRVLQLMLQVLDLCNGESSFLVNDCFCRCNPAD